MIHNVSANQPSFHAVSFSTGLNIILAERSDSATKKDTRNGVGKSTLLEIIDFCLGSSPTKGKGLLIAPLVEWAFTLDITLYARRVNVTRAVASPNFVEIEGSTIGWPEQPEQDERTGKQVFKAERWRSVLGRMLFNLPRITNQPPYKPSYRSLISYFIRRGIGAYAEPFRHYPQQKTWDVQLHVAYLLGMNWEYAVRWQGLKDQEEAVKALENAIKSGAMKRTLGTIGELETQRIQLDQQATSAKEALDTFKVHPQYEFIQEEANRLTQEIHTLLNQNVSDRRRVARYEESLSEEKPPETLSLERMYREAGLAFPENVKRSLEEAKAFHQDIISNRRDFLETEMRRIRESIEGREAQITTLTERRAEIMQVLQTHGALQEMTILQERYVALLGELDRVQARISEMKDLKSTKRELKAAKVELVSTAELDHEDRRSIWSIAVRLFNEHSQALYRTPGNLIIDVDETGYKFQVDIERSGSEGIDKMKIFCFDLALLQLQMESRAGLDFLIHDTLMYDSVDERQRALALERAHEITSAIGAQYICTINSDMVPTDDLSKGFDFQSHVRMKLSDVTPSDSLLGIRFEKPRK